MSKVVDAQTEAYIANVASFQPIEPITTQEQQAFAANVLTSAKKYVKELKAKKKAILDPLKESVKEINALFKPAEDRLAEIEQSIKDAMAAYYEIEAKKQQKQLDSIERRMDKGTLSVETGMAKLAKVQGVDDTLQVGLSSVQFREGTKKVKITDVMALVKERPSLLARERVMEALRLEIAADIKAGAPVPDGVAVYRERSVAVRV